MERQVDEQAVWSRVTAAASACPGSDAQDRGPVGPRLLELQGKKRQAVRDYQRLAQRVSGSQRQLLQRMARENQQQVRRLGALYFFLTGAAAPSPALPEQTRKESYREGLRRLLQEEELSAARLDALAERTQGEVRALLAALAEEDRKRWRLLLPLLG